MVLYHQYRMRFHYIVFIIIMQQIFSLFYQYIVFILSIERFRFSNYSTP